MADHCFLCKVNLANARNRRRVANNLLPILDAIGIANQSGTKHVACRSCYSALCKGTKALDNVVAIIQKARSLLGLPTDVSVVVKTSAAVDQSVQTESSILPECSGWPNTNTTWQDSDVMLSPTSVPLMQSQ